MDVGQIVIEVPDGTVAVSIEAPVGPMQGGTDPDAGAALVPLAAGFRVTDSGDAYFDPGGLSGGSLAALGISSNGELTLTVAAETRVDELGLPGLHQPVPPPAHQAVVQHEQGLHQGVAQRGMSRWARDQLAKRAAKRKRTE